VGLLLTKKVKIKIPTGYVPGLKSCCASCSTIFDVRKIEMTEVTLTEADAVETLL